MGLRIRKHRRASIADVLAGHVLGNQDVRVGQYDVHMRALRLLTDFPAARGIVDELDELARREVEAELIGCDGDPAQLSPDTVSSIWQRLATRAGSMLREEGLPRRVAVH